MYIYIYIYIYLYYKFTYLFDRFVAKSAKKHINKGSSECPMTNDCLFSLKSNTTHKHPEKRSYLTCFLREELFAVFFQPTSRGSIFWLLDVVSGQISS